ncbi:leucine carboxyl methyltransferase [Xylaria sp. CBS 124048]|nr:leucine carboxyl methyltransferase [Xylaria sp. CBS 124048]
MNMPQPSVEARPAAARSAKEKAQDELVMQTNSSSIVSKRSVERIYYPDEPHFFRYFVKKFQRRAPLINRGYYLRLHVIDLAVRRFLERPSDKTKVVVNLGCGSDVLPWQCMTRYPDACQRAKFIDIDFPDLMSKKRTIVLSTPELRSVFEPFDTTGGEHLPLQSDRYAQIGCDLRNTADIENALSRCLNPSDCIFMFVAEVSITYMETQGADGVIEWAGSLGPAEFCLLEQILPDGPDHPFAKTMLSHFEKLNTPLKSVFQYPHLDDQNSRFSRLGWPLVEVTSLWQMWTDDKWITAAKRRELDNVEPFDEWEEFALFAAHYCVVIARNFAIDARSSRTSSSAAAKCSAPQLSPELLFEAYSGTHGKRRFGAPMKMRDELGEQAIANIFGLGTSNRLKSYDLYAFDSPDLRADMHNVGPNSRVGHTIIDLDHSGCLLVGGRASPATALTDCWHFSMERKRWSPTFDLPVPLYRHAMTRLGQSNMALSIGGKMDALTVFTGCLVYRHGSGWMECSISGTAYQPVFGAMLVSFKKHILMNADSGRSTVQFKGILAGGLLQDGTAARQLLRWCLEITSEGQPTISFEPMACPMDIEILICRFGASALLLDAGRFAIVGGIQHDGIVSRFDEAVLLDISESKLQILGRCCLTSLNKSPSIPRPLFVGTSVALAGTGELLIMGGGATCFSMGTYWNEGCYTLNLDHKESPTSSPGRLRFQKVVEIIDKPQPNNNVCEGAIKFQTAKISEIPKIHVSTNGEFEKIIKAGKPVVIEGSDLGTCINKWTANYLSEEVGRQKKVVVHEANSSTMDFNAKNFSYTTKDFGSFMVDVEKGGKQYLRALSEEQPSNLPANIKADFPSIASDFQLPVELSFVDRNEFSSVLRISGRVNMWLHYDVMANVYCQITGAKRLLLFPPDDVKYLSFAPGASSSSIDVFSGLQTAALAMTHPQEAKLEPGDVLFLPPLWLHATAPLTDFGVAVNVFFRNLETGYSSGRDVYGNRDVAAYEKGRLDVARIVNSFGKLPRDMQTFYMTRLAEEMAQNIVR